MWFRNELSSLAEVSLYKRLLAVSCLSVCLPACLRATTRLPLDGFSWNLIFQYISKICEEVPLQCDKNNGYFTGRRVYIYDNNSLNLSYNEKCHRQKSCRENKNTHFMYNNFPPPKKKNRVFYETMWKIWWSRTVHTRQCNTEHSLLMPDDSGMNTVTHS